MQIEFVAGPLAADISPVARIVDQAALPADLDPVLVESARAARFTGKAGQAHEGFLSRDGAIVRVALAGAGEPGAKDRAAALERAGAALTALVTDANVDGALVILTPQAMTDVTGFGLAGHALEMARGCQHTVKLNMSQVPLLHGVRELAKQGMLTGASGRNWSAYGHEVELSADCNAIDQALLSDPQTSGGLLVACTPESVDEVLAVFAQHGFAHACEVGEIITTTASGARLIVS